MTQIFNYRNINLMLLLKKIIFNFKNKLIFKLVFYNKLKYLIIKIFEFMKITKLKNNKKNQVNSYKNID